MEALADGGFVQIVRRFRPALVAFFLRRIGNHAEAEDMAQDVLTRLATGGLDPMRNPDAYIFQMAANMLRDRARREQVRMSYRMSVAAGEFADVETLSPDRVLAGRETLGKVSDALADLPQKTRNIFILYKLEGMKKNDIAANYGMSVSAVDKHLMKAMAMMLKRLSRQGIGEFE